jgi:hypothetical protein
VLILTLLAVGLANLIVSHERLVADMEDWLSGDPVYYVDQVDDQFQRTLGSPAVLSTDPVLPPGPPSSGDFDVTILSVDLQLYPNLATATIFMEENP